MEEVSIGNGGRPLIIREVWESARDPAAAPTVQIRLEETFG